MSKAGELPGFKEYMSGAFLGSAPLIVMAIIISFTDLRLPETEIATVTFILVIIGAILGGFLVADKAKVVDYRSNVLVGGITGLLSFLFTVVYFLIILRIYTGSLQIVVGFIVGGCLGGALSCRTKRV